ncbi:UNVERIFIED_CONTAM: hypothetical protein Sradi_1317000 [Sesamum radiatum]|uniref:Uncharacterized protein n=1 Tax=Sesamum radiatum TaxID=300843 RepID=A0AAW2UNW4_SESRA
MFSEARLGSSPSYTWQSIWDARYLLVAGIRWKDGNGHSIAILGHLWLPRPSTFQLIGRPTSISSELKVATLISLKHEWNESLVKTEFCFMDAHCIFGIPLHGADSHDELVWHFEKSGRFTISSAYQVACDMRDEGTFSQLGWSWEFT